MSEERVGNTRPTVCIKIGGRALEQQASVQSLAREISHLLSDYRCIMIHGGGAEVTRISGRFGLTPTFVDGVRLTTAEEMSIVDMVLAGSINTSLVRAIGRKAVGLTGCDGGIFTGERIAPESHTGRVVETRPELLRELTGAGWIPIVSSVSTDPDGTPLNINADDAALAVARSIGADYLVFISDIPGILASGNVIDSITRDEAEEAIASGVITGGMIPKVRASAAALAAGVGRITIGSYETEGDLAGFLEGRRGTSIVQRKTMKSSELEHTMNKAFVEHVPFPKQYSSPFLELDHGTGCYLWDSAGRKYLDFGSGISVNALGHGRADLADIAAEQMRKLIHVSNLYTTAPAVALAKKLVSLGDFAAVHFGNSGTEANEAAIKFARLYGKRKPEADGAARSKLLCFEHAFHGRTMGALSVTPAEKYQAPFGPLVPGVSVAKLNDIAGLDVLDSGDYCGVVIEPVQGEGGLMRVDRAFASKLNGKCRKLDIILIADEVQTGLGRCGRPLASGAVGLEPDVVSLAKPLAGGLPLSATLIPAKVNDLLGVGDHGTTFGGGPVTTAVAGHVVDTVLAPEFLEQVRRKGEYLSGRLEALVSGIGAFVEVRGLGMLLGIAVAEDRSALLPAFLTAARDRGLLLLRSGSNVIRLAPPLVISEAEIDEGIAIIEAAAAEVFGR